jgi:hypothetical protein
MRDFDLVQATKKGPNTQKWVPIHRIVHANLERIKKKHTKSRVELIEKIELAVRLLRQICIFRKTNYIEKTKFFNKLKLRPDENGNQTTPSEFNFEMYWNRQNYTRAKSILFIAPEQLSSLKLVGRLFEFITQGDALLMEAAWHRNFMYLPSEQRFEQAVESLGKHDSIYYVLCFSKLLQLEYPDKWAEALTTLRSMSAFDDKFNRIILYDHEQHESDSPNAFIPKYFQSNFRNQDSRQLLVILKVTYDSSGECTRRTIPFAGRLHLTSQISWSNRFSALYDLFLSFIDSKGESISSKPEAMPEQISDQRQPRDSAQDSVTQPNPVAPNSSQQTSESTQNNIPG